MKTIFSSSPHSFFISLLLSFAIFTTISCGEVVLSKLHYGFKNYDELRLPNNVLGPESLAFDCDGNGPYTGVSDGRILKWTSTHNKWVEFAVTSPHRDRKLCDGSRDLNKEPICGRPLGLKFDTKTCNLYIADAYFGLLMVGSNGGVAKQLAISADDDDGVPFQFLNGLDIDEKNGIIYFTETSTLYQRREWQMSVLTGDKTGRLLRYDSRSKKVQVLLKDIAFANGVALSKDASFLLLGESGLSKIHKFWLKGPKAYTSEFFVQFERHPDNIKRDQNGDFWVGIKSDRTSLVLQNVDYLGFNPWKDENEALSVGKIAPSNEPDNTREISHQIHSGGCLGQDKKNNQTQMYEVSWRKEEDHVGMKIDEKGNILEVLDGRGGPELDSVSEVKEHMGKLWIGSLSKSYVAVLEYELLISSK